MDSKETKQFLKGRTNLDDMYFPVSKLTKSYSNQRVGTPEKVDL